MGHSATQIVGVIESLDGARPAEGVFQNVVFVSMMWPKGASCSMAIAESGSSLCSGSEWYQPEPIWDVRCHLHLVSGDPPEERIIPRAASAGFSQTISRSS